MDRTPVKVTFSNAAADLALICAAVEQAENWEVLDNELTAQFTEALCNVAAAVDRRKALLRENEARILAATTYAKDLTAYIKRLEKIKERVIESTKQVVLAHPELTFHDSLGKALTVRDNAPRVVVDEAAMAKDPDAEQFMELRTTSHIDLQRVKELLLAGHDISWARLEYGQQVRGLR